MKHLLVLLTLCLSGLCSLGANSPIMVCNASGNTCTPYYNLDSAYLMATPGDYLYIPGGVFTLSQAIEKEIHLYGAGQNLDSSMATNFTTISGNIILGTGAGNSSFEGLYLTGSFNGPSGTAVNNLSFRYCNAHLVSCYMNNSTIHGCIFRSGSYTNNNFYNGSANTISNSYLSNIYNMTTSTIDQCTGLYYTDNIYLTTIKNCILNNYPFSPLGQPGGDNTLHHNIYVNNCPYYCIGVVYTSNITQVNTSNLFAGNFDYHEMHLIPGSPGLTASETGGQVGVYGGLFPYKEGAVPGNPHIYQKTISASTNAAGQLPVQIRVRAENN